MARPSINRRAFLGKATAVVGAVGLAGCGTMTRTRNQPSIRFGGTVSETGNLAATGIETREGYELWKHYINDEYGGIEIDGNRHPIETVLYDDESSKKRAIKLYQRLIYSDDIDFLLGPYSSGITLAVMTIANRNNLPFISTEGASNKIYKQDYKNVFGVLSPASTYLAPIVDVVMAQNNPPKRAGIVHTNDIFARQVWKATVKKINQVDGVKLVLDTEVPTGTSDLSGVITAAKSRNVDFFLGATHTKESIAGTRAARRLRYEPKAMGYSVGPNTAQFIQALGKTANGILGSFQWFPSLSLTGPYFKTTQNYVEQYHKYFGGGTLTYHQALASAGGLAYQRAIEKYAQSTDPEAVISGLNRVDFPSTLARIGFDEREDLERVNLKRRMFATQIQDQSFELVYPRDVGTAKLQYPFSWPGER